MYDEDYDMAGTTEVVAVRKKYLQEHMNFTTGNDELLKNLKDTVLRSWEARGFTITNSGLTEYNVSGRKNFSWHADAKKELEVA